MIRKLIGVEKKHNDLWRVFAKRIGRSGYTEALVFAPDKEEAMKIFNMSRDEREDFKEKYQPAERAEKVNALAGVYESNPVDWTPEEEEILVSAILSEVRAGESQLSGFKKASSMLDKRTIAACDARWNTRLRTEHEKEFVQARREGRKKRDEVYQLRRKKERSE